MIVQERTSLVMDVGLSREPEIGRWLWALQDARKRTMTCLDGLLPEAVDWQPAQIEHSIGTLLYHIALIEADWLYAEVLQQADAPALAALFPYPDRDEQGRLTKVTGIPLADHIRRLDAVRAQVLQVFQAMTLDDFRRVRQLPDYDVTPEWVLHHLLQHEAEHRSEIRGICNKAERMHIA